MQNNPNNPTSTVGNKAPAPIRPRHIKLPSTNTPPNNNNEYDKALTKWANETLNIAKPVAPATTTSPTATTNVAQPHGQQH